MWCTFTAPDIHPPHKEIAITNFVCIPEEIAESGNEQFYQMKLSELILATERHEMNEWLTLDGEHIYEPHPELKDK